MAHLDAVVQYDTLVERGALDLYPERQVRRWLGGREAVTVAEVLDAPAPPGIVFWAVLREYLVGAQALHEIAVDVAEEFLRRERAAGAYIDFRTDRGLAAKRRWLAGRISDGELLVAAQQARRAATDVAEQEDPRVWACARIVCQALVVDAEEAVSQTYYSFIDAHQSRSDAGWLIETARAHLST